jgi:phospholipid-binding lipoprotein MlaA
MTAMTLSDSRPPAPIARRSAAAVLTLSLLVGGCATGPNANPADPLEPFNRTVFTVNEKIDKYVAIPLAKGYRAVTPQPVRTGVTNFFGNLGDVGNTVNNLLQGKVEDSVTSLLRFAINTVFGIIGLFDVATKAGIQKRSQDVGLTLGHWGIGSGPYLVLPLFGPSSFRDGVGLVGDFKLNPATYTDPATRNTLFAINFVNTRSNLLDATELLEQAALDKYSFVRDGYIQRRKSLVEGPNGPRKLPEYEDVGNPPPAEGEKAPAKPAGSEPAPPEGNAPAPQGGNAPPPPAPSAPPAGTPVPPPSK